MAQPEIVDLSEIILYLGLQATLTDADNGLLTMLKTHIENDARRYVRHNITQPADDYIEFHPRTDRTRFGAEIVELSGDVVSLQQSSIGGNIIQLDQIFVRSITEVREDFDGYFGSEASDFPAGSVLTEGTDYYMRVEERIGSTDLNKTGHLLRRSGNWPSRAGTVKVTYNAGFTATELDSDYSDIKMTIIEEVAFRFKKAKTMSGTEVGFGPLKSYSIGGQVAVAFDTSSDASKTGRSGMLRESERRLFKYKRLV